MLIRFLREHRSEWADFNVDAYSAATLKAGTFAYPGMRPTRFTGSQIIMPLGHTIEHEEVKLHSFPMREHHFCVLSLMYIWCCMLQMLEVVRLEGHSLAQEDAFMSRDVHLLQVYYCEPNGS